jgi:hypothetical protein
MSIGKSRLFLHIKDVRSKTGVGIDLAKGTTQAQIEHHETPIRPGTRPKAGSK